jgi:hypothetical protein
MVAIKTRLAVPIERRVSGLVKCRGAGAIWAVFTADSTLLRRNTPIKESYGITQDNL